MKGQCQFQSLSNMRKQGKMLSKSMATRQLKIRPRHKTLAAREPTIHTVILSLPQHTVILSLTLHTLHTVTLSLLPQTVILSLPCITVVLSLTMHTVNLSLKMKPKTKSW